MTGIVCNSLEKTENSANIHQQGWINTQKYTYHDSIYMKYKPGKTVCSNNIDQKNG